MDMRDVRIDSYKTLDVAASGWHLRITHVPTSICLEANGCDGRPGYYAARERLLAELTVRLGHIKHIPLDDAPAEA